MCWSLLLSIACLLGLTLSATFHTKPLPEDPDHPGQCKDESSGLWHHEQDTWKRGGQCVQSSCSVSVGYLDSTGDMTHLEEISPGVYTRFKDDRERRPFSPSAKNITVPFKVRGKPAEYLYVEGEAPAKPQVFVSEQTVTCFYHINLPPNCRETEGDNTLPYPACCPKLACTGEPLGPIEALG